MKDKVTIIIPLRITADVYRAESRLKLLIDTIPSDCYDIIISDNGTASEFSHILNECIKDNVRVVHSGSPDTPVQSGVARNIGAQHAKTDVILFNDLDCINNAYMYRLIHKEIIFRNLRKNAYQYFCVPAFYLTEEATDRYIASNPAQDSYDNALQAMVYDCDKRDIVMPAYATSLIAINRYLFLSTGGNNPIFQGHGAEDFESTFRLTHYCPKAHKTADILTNVPAQNNLTYKGFRAYFALYGLDIFHKGIFFVHLYHPSRLMENSHHKYYNQGRNFAIMQRCMREYLHDSRSQPLPLADLTREEEHLVLTDCNSSAANCMRMALPLLGKFRYMEEEQFVNGEELQDYVRKHSLNSVGFLNPYGNEHRLSLYRYLRENKNTIWVWDRGALPNSWFFDRGFNYDSPSYKPEVWDFELADEKIRDIKSYIQNLRYSSETLENNGNRAPKEVLCRQYKLFNKKILFIPLQRPHDTVIRYFSGAVGDMNTFFEWVREIARRLDKREWVILCKKHPLEDDVPEIENVIFVDPMTHIHDLLELATSVFTINSGVGVLSLLFGKPTICAGQSFYSHDNLAVSVSSPATAYEAICAAKLPDEEKVKRFIYHLKNRLYSFGNTTVVLDKEKKPLAQDIFFDTIRILDREVSFGVRSPLKPLESCLFSVFGGMQNVRGMLERKVSQRVPTVTNPTRSQQPTLPSRAFALVRNPRRIGYFLSHPKEFFKKLRALLLLPRDN